MYAKWIDIAHEMGALSVRCDPGIINLADPSPTIESYKALVSRGRAKDIRVIVENHGTESKHPEELVQILKASGAGALPDFGNFPDEETRERGLRLMFPLAATVCHAKLNPSRFDFRALCATVQGCEFPRRVFDRSRGPRRSVRGCAASGGRTAAESLTGRRSTTRRAQSRASWFSSGRPKSLP